MSVSLTTQPVVLVTGGSEGLGYALAERLLRRGAIVVTCARRESVLAQARATLSQFGEILAIPGDVANPLFRQSLVESVATAYGRVDALVNNASTLGSVPLPSVIDTTLENLRAVFEVNTFAAVDLVQRVRGWLPADGAALILGISSDAAQGGYAGWGVYGSSKAAADLLYRTLGAELDLPHTRVYTVDPGDMATAMHDAADPGATGLAQPDAVAAALMPLFEPLFQLAGATPAFPTGSRLVVAADRLEVRP